MELEVDTKSTLSHVLYRWQSCYNAWDQYCAATKRDNFADSILGRALSSVEERIANSYDIYVDDLGKRFAEGDERFEKDLKDNVDGYLEKLRSLINAQNPTKRKPVAESPSSATQADPRSPIATNWEREAEQVTQSALRAILNALDAMASRMGYVRSTSRFLQAQTPSDRVQRSEVPYCQGALLIQEGLADLLGIIKQPTLSQCNTCKYCFMDICDLRTKAYNYTPTQWSQLGSCHIVACRSFQDRRAVYRCLGCHTVDLDVIEPSASAIMEHIQTCTSMDRKYTQDKHQALPASFQQSAKPGEGSKMNQKANSGPTPTRPSLSNGPPRTTAKPELSRVTVPPPLTFSQPTRPPMQPPRPQNQMLSNPDSSGTARMNSPITNMSSTKQPEEFPGNFSQVPGGFPSTEPSQASPPRPARPFPQPSTTSNSTRRAIHQRPRYFNMEEATAGSSSSHVNSRIIDPTSDLQWGYPPVNEGHNQTAKLLRLEGLGMTRAEAEEALKSAQGDVNQAANIHFAHSA